MAIRRTVTLTTGTDNITGTSNNDTIIGEFATSPANTLNPSDQVNAGAGTDTLKLYGTFTAAQMPVTITGVEVLDVVTAAGAALNLSSYTKAVTGIESVVIENAAALNDTVTTTAGQKLSLATGASNVGTAGAVTWAGSATDTTLDLTLNGYQGGSTATALALTITGAAATTQNIASTTAANKVTTLTLGAATNKVVVTGSQNLTVSTDLVSSGGATILKTVDASAATGKVSIALAATEAASFAFTGGSGNDTIKLANDGYGVLTAGTQLDGGAGTGDKLGLNDTVISTAEWTAINAAKNFEVLGLNAAVTVDASLATSIKEFSLDTSAAQVISNMKTGSIVTVSAAHAANINLSGATGVSDLTFNIGSATSAGLAVGGTLTVGQTAVALSSNGTNAAANVIDTLANADNSTYTVTGANNLTITNALAGTATGTKIDATAFTGKLNVTGSALSDVLIGGTAADTLNAGAMTNGVTAVTAVKEVFTATLVTAADTKTIIFDGVTFTAAGGNGATVTLATTAFVAAYNAAPGATWVAVDNTGTVTFTSKLVGARTNIAVTDFTGDANGVGNEAALVTLNTDGVTAVTAVTQSVDTLTGNGGSDIFTVASSDVDTAGGAVTAVITDFVTGADTIRSTVIAAAGSATNYLEATSAAADLATMLAAADTALAGAVKYYVGQVGADSYLVTDNDASGYTDVIKLTGVALTGIAQADITA